MLLYVHGNQKAHKDGQPRTATSTLTQLLNCVTWIPKMGVMGLAMMSLTTADATKQHIVVA